MARLVITTPCTVSWGGQQISYRKGDTIEAPAALASLIGANARTLTVTPGLAAQGRESAGENVGVSNTNT